MKLDLYSSEELGKLEDCIYRTAQLLYTVMPKEMTLYGGFLLIVQTEIKREMMERQGHKDVKTQRVNDPLRLV